MDIVDLSNKNQETDKNKNKNKKNELCVVDSNSDEEFCRNASNCQEVTCAPPGRMNSCSIPQELHIMYRLKITCVKSFIK